MLHHHVVPVILREIPVYERSASIIYDAAALCRWIVEYEVDLVLHGHMHQAALVWAKYGSDYDRALWSYLVRVTHWTDDDVKREETLRSRYGHVSPDYTANSFADVRALFNAKSSDHNFGTGVGSVLRSK